MSLTLKNDQGTTQVDLDNWQIGTRKSAHSSQQRTPCSMDEHPRRALGNGMQGARAVKAGKDELGESECIQARACMSCEMSVERIVLWMVLV